MGWNTKSSGIAKSNASSAINAITAANCFGDVAKDSAFSQQLSAAQAGALAMVAGLTGGAASFDVAIACVPDSGPGRQGIDHGAVITVTVVERH